jgi:hypothetical protein
MFEFISKKIADIKILHEGYTADYFLNRMKPNALFPILFIQNNLKKNQVPTFFIRLLHMCILEKFYRVIFCFLALISQYLPRNLLREGNNHVILKNKKTSKSRQDKVIQSRYSFVKITKCLMKW